ncbi:MAG: hypothetical protein H7Y30_17385, partial [Pyrinomonadaceae bacterium]|nr:hypothetical protein [Pyrinomonadaceae bacterium]
MNKLKGRSFAELRDRAAQALSAQAERRGLSAHARLPSDRAFFNLLDSQKFERAPDSAESLLEHFRQRTQPKFFASFDKTEATREE